MSDLTNEQKLGLDAARHLAECGVPVFLARPDRSSRTGFRLPRDWQHTVADPTVVDRWKPGMAVCAVMGHLVDAVDIDPRNCGDVSALNATMPRTYGQQATPSGGTHYLIATLGVRNGKPFPGIDVQAGDAEGKGRGFIFLAPTERVSKVTGELAAYRWVEKPNLIRLALAGGDESGAALAAMLRRSNEVGGAPVDSDVPPTPQELEKAANVLSRSARTMAEAVEGARNQTLIRLLPTLYRFVLGGCLDEPTVDQRMREAADVAGIGGEYDDVSASAWRYAHKDGPDRPLAGLHDFNVVKDVQDNDSRTGGPGVKLAVRLRWHVENHFNVFPAGDDGRIFAQPKGGGRAELVSGGFVMRATRGIGDTAAMLSASATEAAKVLSAYAAVNEPRRLGLRVHYQRGQIVLDLAQRGNTRCAVVTPEGWSIQEVPPPEIVFQASGAALPDPERGGSVEELRSLLRWSDDDPRWPLVKGWLPATLLADLPRPMLGFFGPQGSAKTTTGRFVVGVLDPKPAGSLGGGFGKSRADDEIKALKSYLPAWDNVSTLSNDGADLLSRLVTGDLIERRQLYTDADLVTIHYRRTGVITGITVPRGVKPDTLDRFILVAVQPLAGAPVSEGALDAEWERVQPRVLAGVLDLAVTMLSRLDAARGSNTARLRMADYAEALWAIDPRLYDAYATNVGTARADMASDDRFISTLLAWLSIEGGSWEGTAEEARQLAECRASSEQWWPSNAKTFADEVTRTTELLKAVGITVEDRRSNGKRLKRFTLAQGAPVDEDVL